MITIILMTICFCFLIEMFFVGFHLWGIIICVLTLLTQILHIFILKKPEVFSKYKKLLILGGSLVLLVVALFASNGKSESYVLGYVDALSEVGALMDENMTKEALQLLDEVQQEYGLRDAIVMERVACYMIDSNYNAALLAAEGLSDKTSMEYYRLLEKIYKLMEEEGEEALASVYIEAANKYPSWLEMQLAAGIVKLDRKEYSSAKFYFERSYNLNTVDGLSAYYLGMTEYYMGNYEECLYRFNEAVGKGVSNEVKAEIAQYVMVKQEGE